MKQLGERGTDQTASDGVRRTHDHVLDRRKLERRSVRGHVRQLAGGREAESGQPARQCVGRSGEPVHACLDERRERLQGLAVSPRSLRRHAEETRTSRRASSGRRSRTSGSRTTSSSCRRSRKHASTSSERSSGTSGRPRTWRPRTQAGRAYVIDTRIIEVVQPYTPVTEGVPLAPRFAPGCLTLLKQDGTTKELKPVAVKLCTAGASANTHVYAKGGGHVALRAPGCEGVDHGLGHLVGPCRPLAYPDGRDADDHVQRAPRGSPAPDIPRSDVEVAHRLRLRASPGPERLLRADLAAHSGGRAHAASGSARPLCRRSNVLRSRSVDRTGEPRDRQGSLHTDDRLGRLSRSRVT